MTIALVLWCWSEQQAVKKADSIKRGRVGNALF